jgi:hypothetical protein
MLTINYQELEFDHLVSFEDRTDFAAARESGNGRIRLFLINEHTGDIYTRRGRADSWDQVLGSDRYTVIARITAARNKDHIPVYKLSGTSQEFTGYSVPAAN